MKRKVGVAILGLGVVGGGTYKTLVDHRDFYLKTQEVDITVEMVLDKNLERLKELGVPEECIAQNIAEVVTNPAVDIVVETIGGVGIAKEFVLAALKEGKSVVTANKDYYTALCGQREGTVEDSTVLKLELLMNHAGITVSERPVIAAALERAEETGDRLL